MFDDDELNRRSSNGHLSPKRRELAQHALAWIARIHSHTYINIVTTTWCERNASLTVTKFEIQFCSFVDKGEVTEHEHDVCFNIVLPVPLSRPQTEPVSRRNLGTRSLGVGVCVYVHV